MLKIGYDKNVLGKERSQIKKHKNKKIHKFFIERKKWLSNVFKLLI